MMASEAVRLYRSMVRGVAQLPFRHSVREKMQFNLREVFEVRRGVVDADKIAALIVEGREVREALRTLNAVDVETIDLIVRVEDRSAAERP